MRKVRKICLVVSLLTMAAATRAVATDEASRIPAFARKYGVSCNLCHNPMPRLTEFGEMFAANGFRMAVGEASPDTVATGDPTLTLLQDLPLAIRVDAYARTYYNGEVATDFQLPYNMKVLSGGTISNNISYYFYFFLFERGEVGGIEDAFVYFNDIAGQAVDVAVGQFQISDPLFKRELRLEVEDYAVYRARIGDGPTDLTYDRGVMAAVDFGGFTLTGEAVNGNGKGEAGEDRRLDDNRPKNYFGHLTRQIIPGMRLGAMGFFGKDDGDAGAGVITNDVWMLGGDATLSWGDFELNVQYIHREDDSPRFQPAEPTVETDGGFAELLWTPARSRWYALALYNLVDSDAPLVNVRLGGPANVSRYESLTGGIGYRLRQNFRTFVEGTWDIEQEEGRWAFGFTTGF